MSVLRRATSAIALLILAAPLIAQSPTAVRDTTPSIVSIESTVSIAPDSAIVAPAVIARSVSPRLSWTSALEPATTDRSRLAVVRSESQSKSTSTAMMVVGGAGLLVGAIMGGTSGTLFMVGGGLIGLVGLWDYLK